MDSKITSITFLANYRLPTEKAHGFQICKMCEEFSRQGVRVTLWHPSRQNSLKEDIFSYYNLEKNFQVRKIFLPDFIWLKRLIGSFSFWLQSAAFFLRLFWLNLPKKTIVYTRQPELIWLFKKRGYLTVFDAHFWPSSKERILKGLIRRTDFIVTNSKGTALEFEKRGWPRVLAAPNGVDLSEFEGILESKEVLKKKLNLPLDKPLVMYVGHLYKWKGVDLIFEAACQVKAWNFVLVGGKENELAIYRQKAQDKGLTNFFLLGQVKKEKVSRYLKAADCLLLPNVPISRESELYTSPIKMFEYMASGVPIVASDLPSLREILNDKNAFWFKAGEAGDMVRVLGKVFEDAGHSEAVASQAQLDVKEYTWSKRAEKILNFLNSQA